MILKRLLASIIDLLIAIIPVVIVGIYLNISVNLMLYKIVFFYFLHTSIVIAVTKKFTAGERLTGIILKSLKNDKLKFSTLFIRNIVFGLYILLLVISWGNSFEFVLVLVFFLSLNLLIFIKNQNNQPMTAIDFIFKTYYLED